MLLFLIFLEGKNSGTIGGGGGVVIGSKIFGLKFADVTVTTADMAEELRSILRNLESYVRREWINGKREKKQKL